MPRPCPCVQSTAPLSSTAAFEDATSNETVPKFLVLLIRVESDLQLRVNQIGRNLSTTICQKVTLNSRTKGCQMKSKMNKNEATKLMIASTPIQ